MPWTIFSGDNIAFIPLAGGSALIFSLCLCFYTLFTGFILKGDKEGLFAARIFMNLMGNIPLVGKPVSTLFILPGKDLFFLPYLYHCFFLPILILYLIRTHIKRWFPKQGFLYAGVAGLCLYALFVKPFMDIPPDAFAEAVKGPWFFLGIQTLLKSLPATLAGLVFPALFLGCLLILPIVEQAGGKFEREKSGPRVISRGLHGLIVLVFFLYAALTFKAAFWGT